jgi:hypothetical protein
VQNSQSFAGLVNALELEGIGATVSRSSLASDGFWIDPETLLGDEEYFPGRGTPRVVERKSDKVQEHFSGY